MSETLNVPSRWYRAATLGVEVGWSVTVALTPLAVNPWGFNYELPKLILLRALALLMLAAHFLALAWAPRPPDPRRWLRRPLVRPVLLVVGIALLSTLTSLTPLTSLLGSYHRQQGAYLLLVYVLWALLVSAHLRTPAQRRRLASTVIVTGSLVAATPFIEALYWHKNPFTWRPGGSLGNPIFLGAYLIMVIPFTLAHLLTILRQVSITCRRVKTIGWGAALVLQLFALAVTQSRGPWLGGLTGVTVLVGLTLWTSHRRLVLVGLIGTPLLLGGLLAGLNFDLIPSERLSQLPYVRRFVPAAGLASGTGRVRLVLWEAVGELVMTWPEIGLGRDKLHQMRPLLGYGPDTAAIAYIYVYPPELSHIEDPDAVWDRAHNETLDLLTTQGWLGLAAHAALGVACARRGWALWRTATNSVQRAQIAAPLAALAAHLVEVQFAFSVTTTNLMAWLCLAWLASPSQRCVNQGLPEPLQGWRPALRWRIYAVVGALLLTLTAVRLEGCAVWADTLAARARSMDRTGQWGESIELYDRALGLVPWQAIYHQFRAEAFYNLAYALPDRPALQEELFAAAARGLSRARRLEPLQVSYYANAGVLHALWSEADPAHLETAVGFYEQAIRLAPTRVELRTELGHVYHQHHRYDGALAEYLVVLEIDPEFASAYYGAGLARLAMGQTDLARQALQTALDMAPDCDACREVLKTLNQE